MCSIILCESILMCFFLSWFPVHLGVTHKRIAQYRGSQQDNRLSMSSYSSFLKGDFNIGDSCTFEDHTGQRGPIPVGCFRNLRLRTRDQLFARPNHQQKASLHVNSVRARSSDEGSHFSISCCITVICPCRSLAFV